MEKTEIFHKMTSICHEVFEDDSLVITEETVAKGVKGWDSLTHFMFISEVEMEFHIRFTMQEIQTCKNVGELADALVRHLEREQDK